MSSDQQLLYLKKFFIKPRKALGQHFVINEEVLYKIVDSCHIQKNDTVIEIGAGLGALTTKLADRAQTVLAIEKDGKLAHLLRSKIITQKNVRVIHQDAFLFDYDLAWSMACLPLKVVGNLPYNVASRLCIDLLKKGRIGEMSLMFQKEVAERIISTPGNKSYGFLTIMVNLYAEVAPLFHVARTDFYPQPKVESTLIHFKVLPHPREPLVNEKYFVTVVKTAFAQRRKKLRNALKPLNVSADYIERICSETGIDPDRRGETLSLREFALLGNQLLAITSPQGR